MSIVYVAFEAQFHGLCIDDAAEQRMRSLKVLRGEPN